jgi:hypothetical protein
MIDPGLKDKIVLITGGNNSLIIGAATAWPWGGKYHEENMNVC